jgi:Sigma-54 interaction domain
VSRSSTFISVQHTTRSSSFAASESAAPAATRVPLPASECQVLLKARPNVLLEGPESAVAATLLALKPFIQAPVQSLLPHDPLRLPESDARTFVVHDVDGLSGEDQNRLFQWLGDRPAGLQVIATTSHPLFEMTMNGAFLPALYYRLNVVRIAVSDQGGELHN